MTPLPTHAPDDAHQNADVLLLRHAAVEIRKVLAGHRTGPGQEYFELGTAKLLDSIAGSLARGDHMRDDIRTHAVELARHALAYCTEQA
jgi:hypothetical protein